MDSQWAETDPQSKVRIKAMPENTHLGLGVESAEIPVSGLPSTPASYGTLSGSPGKGLGESCWSMIVRQFGLP